MNNQKTKKQNKEEKEFLNLLILSASVGRLGLEFVEFAHYFQSGPEFDLHGVDQMIVSYQRESGAVDLLRLEELRHLNARHTLDKLKHLVAVPLSRVTRRQLLI